MALFRKKPIVIDAVQFEFLKGWPLCVCNKQCGMAEPPHIHTLEGPLHISDKDWIIEGVFGEYYPCKPDIFEKTYEKA